MLAVIPPGGGYCGRSRVLEELNIPGSLPCGLIQKFCALLKASKKNLSLRGFSKNFFVKYFQNY
jgi:hypothetical protein